MLIVNRDLYQNPNILNFFNDSMNCLISEHPELKDTKEFFLFCYIRDDFFANINSLYSMDIDLDWASFPVIRRNTRHAVEAFLDLFNLCRAPYYEEVLKYCAHKLNGKKDLKKYGKYLVAHRTSLFTIPIKYEIAQKHGGDFQEIVDVAKDSNSYAHSDAFIPKRDNKEENLRDLLSINLRLFNGAYRLMLEKFNRNEQPNLRCFGCCCQGINCYKCHTTLYNKFFDCINGRLLIQLNNLCINNYSQY